MKRKRIDSGALSAGEPCVMALVRQWLNRKLPTDALTPVSSFSDAQADQQLLRNQIFII